MIRRAVLEYPDATAVADRSVSLTLAECVDAAERLANSLDGINVPRRAAVGVLADNCVKYVVADLALALGRRVRVALNSRLHRSDFRYALQNCDARAIIHSGAYTDDAIALADELGLVRIDLDAEEPGGFSFDDLVESASPLAVIRQGDPEETAWISYTSGTTGVPKGVVLSHRAVREVAFNLELELGPFGPGRRAVLTQPLSHGSGYLQLPLLWSGAGIYLLSEGFDPEEVLHAGRQDDVKILKAAPAMFPPLFEAHDRKQRGDGFDTIIYGAAPMPSALLEEGLDRFGPVMVQNYGQTEAPMTITCLGKLDHLAGGEARGSAGRPWRSVQVEVRGTDGSTLGTGETGELTVRGRHHMTEYLDLPEATAEVLRDGWVWTRDMAQIDERGFVHLLGRRDEIINSGGFNVAPREVEAVLENHPAVQDCAVLGVPDPRWGTAIQAVVQLRAGASASDEQLISFARPRLAFRTPKRILVLSKIPKNAYGKTDRSAVMSALVSGSDSTDG